MPLFAVILISVVGTVLAMVLGFALIPNERKLRHEVSHVYGIGHAQFQREMGVLLGPAINAGNRVEYLANGDQIFPAMLAAIRGAQRSITFETYIYWSGDIGKQFADALIERAQAGVAVHVLLDWVGSQQMDDALIGRLHDNDVQIQRYHPLRWYDLARMNNRTHRKLLVTDGRIGFTGGVGIADQWQGHAQDPEHWRDIHFQVEGPVVAQIQSVFMSNWIKASGQVLRGEDYFPALPRAGDYPVQMFSSSPSGGSESMQLMYLMVLAAATRSIDLSASYFVPEEVTRKTLVEAMQRGVRLRIISPGKHIDASMVRAASRADWGELLAAGALMHEYQPTMIHNKMIIVDGLLVSVGSTNFDNRSFSLNDEASLNIYDQGFAAQMTEVFEHDLKDCRRITFEEWSHRPWRERVRDRMYGMLAAQL